jgi:RimJ/RimL family protein N-acetyltransferase
MAETKTVTLRQRGASPAGAEIRLASERLTYCSPPGEGAAAEIAAWFRDPDVARFLAAPLDTPQRAQAVIGRTNNRSEFFFGVYDRDTGRIVGYTQVHIVGRHRSGRTTSMIGDKAYWGGGYATEARSTILDFLFLRRGLNKVSSYVYSRNIPAIFNNRALGYTCEGVLRQQERNPGGGYRDVLCFGILRSEWLARRQKSRPATG